MIAVSPWEESVPGSATRGAGLRREAARVNRVRGIGEVLPTTRYSHARPLSGPDAAGAAPEVPRIESGACGGSALGPRPSLPAPRLARMSRFLERLASGPPIVADGGMGALLASAVPGLRCPEEANLRAPESVVDVHLGYIRAGAELIETNTFGANRPKLAQHFLEDEFERINSAGVKLAREAREVSGARRLHRRLDRPARRRRAPRRASRRRSTPSRRGSSRAAASTSSWSRRSSTSTISRRRSTAIRSVSALPIVALMTFDSDRRDARRRLGRATRGARLGALDVAAFGANHGAGPGGRARRARRRCGRGRVRSRRCRTSASRACPGSASCSRTRRPRTSAQFAAQARALGAAIIGGCCGTTPAQIAAIRAAVDENRRAARLRCSSREREAVAPAAPRDEPTQLAAAARRRRVRRLRAARSAARREPGGAARDRACGARVGQGAVRRRERQPARARAHERDHGVRRDRAASPASRRSRT